MKTHDELIRDVHSRIDAYNSAKKMKEQKIKRIAVSVSPVCAAAFVGVGLWKTGVLSENNKPVSMTIESPALDSDFVLTTEYVRQSVTTDVITKNEKTTKNNSSTAVNKTETEAKSDEDITENDTQNEITEDNTSDLQQNEEVINPFFNEENNNNDIPNINEEEHSDAPFQTESAEYTENYEFGDMLGYVVINGVVYLQIFDDEYTAGEYIGCAADYEGLYRDDEKLYFSLESSEIIVVRFYDGSMVYLQKTDLNPHEMISPKDAYLY